MYKIRTSCRNNKCPHYRRTGAGNIIYKSKMNGIFFCKGCRRSWSENVGSFLYNLKTPTKVVLRCLLSVSTGNPLRKTARDERVTTDSIFSWVSRAEENLPEVLDLLEGELRVNQKQLRQFYNFMKQTITGQNS